MPLEPDCQRALDRYCRESGANPSDPELAALAGAICGAAGAASLDYWLNPSDDKSELLRKLTREHGALDAETLSLIEQLLGANMTFDHVVLYVRGYQARRAAETAQEEARRLRDEDGFTP